MADTRIILEPTLVDILAPIDSGDINSLSEQILEQNCMLLELLNEIKLIRIIIAEMTDNNGLNPDHVEREIEL